MAAALSNPIVRTTYRSSEPLEVREFLERAYGAQLRLGADDGAPWEVSLTQTQAGPVTVAEVDMPVDLSFQMTGHGDYVFSSLIRGTSERVHGDELERYGRGDLLLAVDPQDDSHYRASHARARTVTLAGSVLDDLARRDPTEPAGGWRFTERRAIAGGRLRWNQTVALLSEILDEPQTSATALVLGPATRLLAATALTVFPNTLTDTPGRADGRDGHPDALRRAVAFIDANPDLDITLADVARAAKVTPRAVQLAFRRHLDTTPLAYLRRLRLHHAHLDLQAATAGDGQTVTRIAMDWGFANPSHFATHYRAAYGQPPSRTLRD